MKKIFLIFPNQLFKIKQQFLDTKFIALIEDSLFFGCDPQWKQIFHRQKIVFHKATMDFYAEYLRESGLNVIHIKHKRAPWSMRSHCTPHMSSHARAGTKAW